MTIESSWSATVHENRSERSATPVSVLGLGMLGSELARAFLDHGHATTVWNRSHGKADDLVAGGAIRAATAEEAVSASALVVVCVSDYAAVREILDASGEACGGEPW